MATVSNVSLFAPQFSDIERQRQMASLLQQQANAPIEIQSYKGIQAPIPTTAVLAKALEGFAAARRRKQADTAERILRQKEEDIRKAEADAAAKAYETGVYSPPQIDKTASAEVPGAAPSRAMQMAKALGLGDVANRARSVFGGPQPAPIQPNNPAIPNFADIPYAQPPQAPVAAPAAMTPPAVGGYNPASGFGLSGIAPSPSAVPPPPPAAAPVALGTPEVMQKPAPTLQDRQRAYYQALAASRDPSVAANARDRLMQLDQQQATNQAITNAFSGMDNGNTISTLINSGISPSEATRMYASIKDNGYEVVTPGDGYSYVVDPSRAADEDMGVVAKIGQGKAMNLTSAQVSTLPRVKNDSDYNALSSGQRYVAPDGSVRTKS